MFLLSGLFCCLSFSGVIFFLFGRGRVVFFVLLFGRGRGPRPNSKKTKDPAQTAKNINTPPPLPSVFVFCCLGGWACLFFLLFLGRGSFFFGCLGRWRVLFCCLGGVRVYVFAVWARVVFFVLAVWARGGGGGGGEGGGTCFFVFFGCLGGEREFTHFPVCLARLQATQQQKRPNSKKKQKHGFPITLHARS